IQSANQSVEFQFTAQASGTRDVIERIVRFHAIEHPQALLGEGKRQALYASDFDDGRDFRRARGRLVDPLGESDQGGRFEERAERDLDMESLPEPGDDLGGQQGMAAEIEEVVVDADRVRWAA